MASPCASRIGDFNVVLNTSWFVTEKRLPCYGVFTLNLNILEKKIFEKCVKPFVIQFFVTCKVCYICA